MQKTKNTEKISFLRKDANHFSLKFLFDHVRNIGLSTLLVVSGANIATAISLENIAFMVIIRLCGSVVVITGVTLQVLNYYQLATIYTYNLPKKRNLRSFCSVLLIIWIISSAVVLIYYGINSSSVI